MKKYSIGRINKHKTYELDYRMAFFLLYNKEVEFMLYSDKKSVKQNKVYNIGFAFCILKNK